MKTSTFKKLVSYFNGDKTISFDELRNEINEENDRLAKKANVNRNAYNNAKIAVLSVINDVPKTDKEIYESVKAILPLNFSQSKVRYGLLHFWTDEVTVIDNGRNPNTYVKKVK